MQISMNSRQEAQCTVLDLHFFHCHFGSFWMVGSEKDILWNSRDEPLYGLDMPERFSDTSIQSI